MGFNYDKDLKVCRYKNSLSQYVDGYVDFLPFAFAGFIFIIYIYNIRGHIRSPWGIFYLVPIAAPGLSQKTLTTVGSMTEVHLDDRLSLFIVKHFLFRFFLAHVV